MSQSGILDIESTNPQIPTSFTTDAGTAIPIANDLEVLGTNGITTSGAGGTVTITGVAATAGATAPAAIIGVSSFDSAHFTVTAGFVQLSGGIGAETFLTDDGAPSVEPDGTGEIKILGGTAIDVTGQGPGNTITISSCCTVATTYDTDSGSAVPAANILNLVGGNSVTVSGSGNTVTVKNLADISKYVVDGVAGETGYQTVQSAIDAANVEYLSTGIPVTIYVKPGVYTENLTLYDGLDLHAALGQVDSKFLTIVGTHMLPASGSIGIYGIWFTGTTACFNAPIGGTTKVNMFNVITEITGVGYTFDVDGFSGELNIFDYLQFDTGTNGFIYNPTGGCEVNIIFAGINLTRDLTATAQISGSSFFQGMLISINMNFVGNSSTLIDMGCDLQGTISTDDSASVNIQNTYSRPDTGMSINHLSTGVITLSNVAIDSSHATPIAGTGTIELGSTTFLDNAEIAGTITLQSKEIRGGTFITRFTVDPNGETPYSTIQSAIDAAQAVGNVALVYIRAGSYAENLTLYDGIDLEGAGNTQVFITGIAVPPNTGTIAFSNLALLSGTHAFNSAAAGTTTIKLRNVLTNCTNGYTFNLPNWGAGDIYVNNVNCSGTNDGFLNNTGDISLICEDSELGNGAGHTTIVNGEIISRDCEFGAPMTISGASTSKFINTKFLNNVDFTVGCYAEMICGTFETGANIPISFNTTGDLTLSNVTINTSNIQAIDGAGAGTVYDGGITYLDGSSVDITTTISVSKITTTSLRGWNGSFVEIPSVSVASDGATITFSIEKSGGGDLTLINHNGFYFWDTTPADTVTLTAGTDTNPTLNYVYLDGLTKVLTANTTGFPATGHARIAEVICQSAASIQTKEVYSLHNVIGHLTSSLQAGHISHLNEWIRHQHATWISGVAPTLTITTNVGSSDNVIFTSASGTVLQLHEHDFPSFTGTPDVYTVNDSATPYNLVTDLNSLLTDSDGDSMSGRYFSLVIWGVISESTGECKLMVNLPSGSYGTANYLLKDVRKEANFSIPADFKGTGFLIAQLNLHHTTLSGGTWTEVSVVDLRGLYPSLAAGGQNSQGSEFLDTEFRILDDADNTKEIAFQASGITAGNTRTMTVQDADGIIAYTNVANYGTGATSFTDHGVLAGSGTAAITALAVGANGQVLLGSTGADPVFGTISNGNNISWTLGAGTLEADLTGTTDHSIQLGNATGSLTSLGVGATGTVVIGNTAADPSFSSTPTVTTVFATTFDTNVTAAGLTASGTTIEVDGTDANINLNLSSKGVAVINGNSTIQSTFDNSTLWSSGNTLVPNLVGLNSDTTGRTTSTLLSSRTSTGGASNYALVNVGTTGSSGDLYLANGGGTYTGSAMTAINVFGETGNFYPFTDGGPTLGLVGNNWSKLFVQTISNASASTHIAISTAGEVTKPLQPAFLAYNSATDANQTGNGATATVDFDTEAFDQNADFAADTFTAPITGRYDLKTGLHLNGMTSAMTEANMTIVTSNRSYVFNQKNWGGGRSATGFAGHFGAALADMDAADTAIVQVVVLNGAGNTAGIFGTAGPYTFFSGSLIC